MWHKLLKWISSCASRLFPSVRDLSPGTRQQQSFLWLLMCSKIKMWQMFQMFCSTFKKGNKTKVSHWRRIFQDLATDTLSLLMETELNHQTCRALQDKFWMSWSVFLYFHTGCVIVVNRCIKLLCSLQNAKWKFPHVINIDFLLLFPLRPRNWWTSGFCWTGTFLLWTGSFTSSRLHSLPPRPRWVKMV